MKLIYDIASMPSGLDPGNMVKMYEQHHVVFWDSTKNSTKPKLFKTDGDKDIEVLMVDSQGKELSFEQYTDQYRDEEFWKRELHNCTNSPLYFFNNYGTTVYPATQEATKAFMKEIGLEEIVAKDSEDATALWEAQKAKVKKAMSVVTLDFLRERGAIIEVLKSAYNDGITKLEETLKEHVRLVDSNNVPLPDKKRISNLADKISKCYPIHSDYSDKYRTRKGKWDRPMLYNTSYGILLKMYDVVREPSDKQPAILDTPAK